MMACLRSALLLRSAPLRAPSSRLARYSTCAAPEPLTSKLGAAPRRAATSLAGRPQTRTLAYKLESGMQDIREGLSDEENFLFDTNGYIIVKNVFTQEEVAAANAAVDANADSFQTREGHLRQTPDGSYLAGDGSTCRMDMGRMLEWQSPQSDVFRQMLVHPKLLPYYNNLVGKGYRMDHLPILIQQERGAEGFTLHGGATHPDGSHLQELAFNYKHGRMYNTLLGASLCLTSAKIGDGGFCILKGSHKSNYPCPDSIKIGAAAREHLYQPECEAGDVILFSEACTHGTLAWQGEHTRRVAIYRFSPSYVSYGRSVYAGQEGKWPEGMYDDAMTDAMRAVLLPAYHNRLDRPAPAADGESVEVPQPRLKYKMDHDAKVFGTKYF